MFVNSFSSKIGKLFKGSGLAICFMMILFFAPALETSAAPNACVQPPSDLVSWWRAEGNANDTRGNNHGTLQNGTTFLQGKVGQGFGFDGVDDFIFAPDSNSLDIVGDLTIEAWINPSVISGNQRAILSKREFDNSNVTYAFFLQPNGHLTFYAKNGGNLQIIESTGSIPTNIFTHVAVTIAGTSLRLYINGVSDTTTTLTVARLATNGRLTIGRAEDVTGASNIFAGSIDELSIYNRALSTTEIQSIFNVGNDGKCLSQCVQTPSNLVSWWRAEGNANDTHGNNNGTLQNGATFAQGKVGQGFSFDGVNDYINVPINSSLYPGTNSFAFSAWIKAASSSEPQVIFSQYECGGQCPLFSGGSNYDLRILLTGILQFAIRDHDGGGNEPSGGQTLTGGRILNDGFYHYVVAQRNTTTNQMEIYVDGTLDINVALTSGANGSLQPDGDSEEDPFTIGASTLNTIPLNQRGRFFGGIIDELDYYSRALTPVEIQALFNAGSDGKCVSSSPTNKFDFDGDNKTDISIFRPAPGEWWYQKSSNGGNAAFTFGTSSDKIVPADYTGDGKTDVAFFRSSSGQWFVLRSEDNSFFAFPFGNSTDVPIPADYDGDGKADAAVFRPSTLTWFINKSSGGTDIITFGAAGDKPVVSDYDGDGKADIAIYRNNGGVSEWWIRRSSTGTVFAVQFGAATDKAVQGDYTGDGKTDIAVWRPSTGDWFILRSEDFSFYAFPFGANGDTPVAGDYDGDGKFDAGVFRPTSSTWFIQRSTAGTLIQTFGITGDQPVPNAFVP